MPVVADDDVVEEKTRRPTELRLTGVRLTAAKACGARRAAPRPLEAHRRAASWHRGDCSRRIAGGRSSRIASAYGRAVKPPRAPAHCGRASRGRVQGVSRSRPPGEICPSANFPAKLLDLNESLSCGVAKQRCLPLLFRAPRRSAQLLPPVNRWQHALASTHPQQVGRATASGGERRQQTAAAPSARTSIASGPPGYQTRSAIATENQVVPASSRPSCQPWRCTSPCPVSTRACHR
jgi:hypothetical protein